MRHRKAGLKLNRTSSHRKAMFRNMVTSLIKHEKIRTTDAKAKELRRWGDKLVTLAKRGDLHARRQALAIVRERAVVKKLFDEAPERFANISGGYTRVVKLGRRPGDAAAMSLVAFVSADDVQPKKAKKKPVHPKAESGPKKAKTLDTAGEKSDGQAPPGIETAVKESAETDDRQATRIDDADVTGEAGSEPAAPTPESATDAGQPAASVDMPDDAKTDEIAKTDEGEDKPPEK